MDSFSNVCHQKGIIWIRTSFYNLKFTIKNRDSLFFFKNNINFLNNIIVKCITALPTITFYESSAISYTIFTMRIDIYWLLNINEFLVFYF